MPKLIAFAFLLKSSVILLIGEPKTWLAVKECISWLFLKASFKALWISVADRSILLTFRFFSLSFCLQGVQIKNQTNLKII